MKTIEREKPKVSVVMPVYKGEEYIAEAIKSILNQTYDNFELIIINDCSPDRCGEIISKFKDERIVVIKNEENIGLVSSLNKGIRIATGEYIARMDQDDISLPRRLETQVQYMESNPDIGICGANVKTIGKIKGYVNKKFVHAEENKAILLFHVPFTHPVVMMRKKIIEENNLFYDKNFEYCEDYELWARSSIVTKLSNIDKVLMLYRIHETNMSQVFHTAQSGKADLLRRNLIETNLGIKVNDEDLLVHRATKSPEPNSVIPFLTNKEIWFQKLIMQNNKLKYYQEPYFSNIISIQWLAACYANINHFSTWKIFWKSDLSKKIPPREWRQILKFFVKCLLNKK